MFHVPLPQHPLLGESRWYDKRANFPPGDLHIINDFYIISTSRAKYQEVAALFDNQRTGEPKDPYERMNYLLTKNPGDIPISLRIEEEKQLIYTPALGKFIFSDKPDAYLCFADQDQAQEVAQTIYETLDEVVWHIRREYDGNYTAYKIRHGQ